MIQTNIIELRSYPTDSVQHSHEHSQLILPLKGELELEVNHQAGLVHANKFAFIGHGEQHSFSGSENNLFLVIDIQDALSSLEIRLTTPFSTFDETTLQLLVFIEHTLRTGLEDEYTKQLMSNLLINTIIQSSEFIVDKLISKAKNWIDMNYAQPIHINFLAKLCFISSSQLQRRFKSTLGITIGQYWRLQRLKQAKRLLAYSKYSVEVIALKVGYDYASAFCRAFNQQFNVTPSQWREKNHNK